MSFFGQWHGQTMGQWWGFSATVQPPAPQPQPGGGVGRPSRLPRLPLAPEIRPRIYRYEAVELIRFIDTTRYVPQRVDPPLAPLKPARVQQPRTFRPRIDRDIPAFGFSDATTTRFLSPGRREEKDLLELAVLQLISDD